MADKRTTPEAPPEGAPQAAPEGPRRNKRAAPTIDLTATEVPPAQPAAPSQPEPPPATNEPPAGSAGGEPPNTVAKRPAGSIAMAALAGAAGAATVLLILLALWLTGLVPLRYAASIDTTSQVAMDTTAIDALTQRVEQDRRVDQKTANQRRRRCRRLAAAESAMKSLGVTLTALNRRSDDIAATANQARERADARAKAVTELRASVQDAAKNSSAGISPCRIRRPAKAHRRA